MDKILIYQDISTLMDDWTPFKSNYFNGSNWCFKKNTPFESWKQNPTDDKKWGIVNIDGTWSWKNRINTHVKCAFKLCEWALIEDPNIFKNLGNPSYDAENMKRLWNFYDINFEKYFTTNITSEYYLQLKKFCYNSWMTGIISTIVVIKSLKLVFEDFVSVDFSFEYGISEDMNGVDLTFKLKNSNELTIQIKSGEFLNMRTEYIGTGSSNHLKYTTDFYAYTKINSYGITSISIFNNNESIHKNEYGEIVVKCDDMIYYNQNIDMILPKTLTDILSFCSTHNSFLTIKHSDKKNVSINKIDNTYEFIIEHENFDDPELDNEVILKFEELKQLFN